MNRRKLAVPLAGVALAAGTYFAWRLFFAMPAQPASIIELSGRIEGDDSAISPKTSGA